MGGDLSEEISRIYKFVKKIDRVLIKFRSKNSFSRQSIVSFTKLALLFLLIIPIAAVTSYISYRINTHYFLLTGLPGSTTAKLSPRIQSLLNVSTPIEQFLHLNIQPDFRLQPSCGGLDTSKYLRKGVAHLGFAEDGIPESSFEEHPCSITKGVFSSATSLQDNEKMRILIPLYKSPLHIVSRSKLGYKDINDISPNTKVYLGMVGSTTYSLSQLIIQHFGLQLDIRGHLLDFEQAAQALLDNEIDVAFFLTGLQTENLKKLLQKNSEFQLLQISHSSSLKILFPYLESLTIPSAIYPNVHHDIQTIGTNTVLVASTVLGETESYEITTKLASHIQDILWDIPLNFARTIDNDPSKELYYQIDSGAHRYFSHNPPFFLNWTMITGIGAYFSLIYAFYIMLLDLLRNYRIYRILLTADAVLENIQKQEINLERKKRLEKKLQQLRSIGLKLMRRRKITFEEFNRIEDYIKVMG